MHLRNDIKNKRLELLSKGVTLLRDKVHVHSAAQTTILLKNFQWDVFPHPWYSPDLVPCNYHLFPILEMELSGKRFRMIDELKKSIFKCFVQLNMQTYCAGIRKLIL